MTAREELIAALTSEQHAPMSEHDPRDGSCRSCPWPLHVLSPDDIADALLAEGWRKKPSREAIERTVRAATAEYFREDIPEGGRDESDCIADAILALMDGSNDE